MTSQRLQSRWLMANRSNRRRQNPFSAECSELALPLGSQRANSPLGSCALMRDQETGYTCAVEPLCQNQRLANGEESIHAETSRRTTCDCSIIGMIESEQGEPLSIGRKTRAIPPAMRRALRARDKGCRFPGCTNTHFIDGHHVRHWADGGETRLDNLLQLCRHHHRLVHDRDAWPCGGAHGQASR